MVYETSDTLEFQLMALTITNRPFQIFFEIFYNPYIRINYDNK